MASKIHFCIFSKLTKSTPKMKKKTFGELAMVLGDCQWLMYTGRNYKVGN